MVLGLKSLVQLASTLAFSSVCNGLAVPSIRSEQSILDAYVPEGVIVSPLKATKLNSSVAISDRSYLLSDGGAISEITVDVFFAYFVSVNLFDAEGKITGSTDVLVDTGSSDLWTYSNYTDREGFAQNLSKAFKAITPVEDAVTTELDLPVEVIRYADNSSSELQWWTGSLGFDNNSILLDEFRFGSALASDQVAGILGIGPKFNELDAHKNHTFTNKTYPNFPVALKEQGYTKKVAFSVFLGGFDELNILTTVNFGLSTIIWGGIDHGLYTGELVRYPSASQQWPTLNLETIVLDDGTEYPINQRAILDTGTSTAAFPRAFLKQLNETLGVDEWGSATKYTPFGNQTFTFDFGASTIDVPYTYFVEALGTNYTLYPIHASEDIGEIILGDIVLRSVYFAVDYEENSVSIAQANFANQIVHNITVIE